MTEHQVSHIMWTIFCDVYGRSRDHCTVFVIGVLCVTTISIGERIMNVSGAQQLSLILHSCSFIGGKSIAETRMVSNAKASQEELQNVEGLNCGWTGMGTHGNTWTKLHCGESLLACFLSEPPNSLCATRRTHHQPPVLQKRAAGLRTVYQVAVEVGRSSYGNCLRYKSYLAPSTSMLLA